MSKIIARFNVMGTFSLFFLQLIGDLVDCLICRGEEDEIIPVLETYLKQVETNKLHHGFVLCSLHRILTDCYTVSGDLSKAIEHCEEMHKISSTELKLNDMIPSYIMNTTGFSRSCNIRKPMADTDVNKLRHDRDRNAHNEINWKADLVKKYRDVYAPLMGRIDWFTDDLD